MTEISNSKPQISNKSEIPNHNVSNQAGIVYAAPLSAFLHGAVGCLRRPAWALDSIKTSKALISGSIVEMGKYTVKIKRTGDREETVQVNEIEYIRLDGEPAQFNIIRSAINAGRYKDALEGLDKLQCGQARGEAGNRVPAGRDPRTARHWRARGRSRTPASC